MTDNNINPYLYAGYPTGYNEAGASRKKRSLKGFRSRSSSPRSDIDLSNYTLRQRSRMLYMSSPTATSAIKTSRTNVIGRGLRLKSRACAEALGLSASAAADWRKVVEDEFTLWAEDKTSCDATGINDFYAIQQLAFMSWQLSGDCFVLFKHFDADALKPYSLRLHVIEADRISTPYSGEYNLYMTIGVNQANGNKIYDGVEVDSHGAAVAFYICDHYPFERLSIGKMDWKRIPIIGNETKLPNILQIMNSERPDQYRGVPLLAQVIEVVLQGRRYTEAEITAAVVQSYLTAFITKEGDASYNPLSETKDDNLLTTPDEYQMGAGEVIMLKEGEGVNTVNPTHPNSTYSEFMGAINQQIGAAVEIPKDILTKKYDSSYSAARASNNEAWKAFKMSREWFISDFCRPVYEVWLAEAVASGRINAPGFFTDAARRKAWLGSDWIGPSQGMLDPTKEIAAEIALCEHGMSSWSESTIKLTGGDFNANIARLAAENEQLKSVGDKESVR